MSQQQQETEVKIRIESVAKAEELLRREGFRVISERAHEFNWVFDTPDATLRRNGCLLRLRSTRGQSTLTYKGPATAGKHKSREELEVAVSDGAIFCKILEKIGLQVTFRYEKYRAEYARPNEPGLVTVDDTPIGVFLELEGPGFWIDETAARLGYKETDYITDSYGKLYAEYCQRQDAKPGDMTFAGR